MRTVPAVVVSAALLLARTGAAAGRPNILHLHADDHRPDGLGALGNPVLKTPNLDALVARGMTFTHCYTMGSMVGAVCTPSRTMLLTGRSWQRIPGAPAAAPDAGDPATFLPKVIAAAGYETWHMGKGGNAFKPGIQAFDTCLLDDAQGEGPAADRAHACRRMADTAVRFLESRDPSKPFYMYLAPPVPHDPRSAEPQFHAMYDPAKIPLSPAFLPQHPWDNGEMTVRDEKLAPWPRTPADTCRQLAEYYACISGLDHHAGRIFDALKRTGQWENTVVVFSGDNGLSLGEHGLFGKQNLYEFGGMHAPLVVAGPGIPKGRTDALVYLMDLFPTFCDFAGAKAPAGIDGRNLRPVIEGKAPAVRDALYTGYKGGQRAVRDDRWKLIRYPLVDRTQLFDLQADPHELTNLAGRAEHAVALRRMTALLEREMKAYDDGAPLKVDAPAPADWTPPPPDAADPAARTGRASLPGPAAAGAAAAARPNILFVIFDDWGWPHAGAYGCPWVKTPNFDRVAREGVLFRNAFTSNPKCSPCRASILTGRNSWQLEEAVCHFGIFPAKFAVYPDLMERTGHAVGLTGKGWGPGDWKSTGFPRNPAGPEFQRRRLVPPASGIGTCDYVANFEDFLGTRKPGQPFCFWMGFTEPHRGYEPDSGIRAGKKPADVTVPAYLPDNDVVRRDLLDYAVEVEWGDAQLGRALALLEARGELDRTVVVVTSDHGMPFPRVKGQIYEDGFHLPLAIRWGARCKGGRVVDDFINVRDFAPTFLELADAPAHPQITGRSFADILLSPAAGWIDPARNAMLAGKERHDLGRPNDWGYPVRALRTPEYLYVHNYNPERWPACDPETDFGNCDPGPTKEWLKAEHGRWFELSFGKRPADALYRIAGDSSCVRDLAADPAHADTVRALRERMDAMLRAEQDPRALGNSSVFDTYRYVGDRKKAYDTWLNRQPASASPPPP